MEQPLLFRLLHTNSFLRNQTSSFSCSFWRNWESYHLKTENEIYDTLHDAAGYHWLLSFSPTIKVRRMPSTRQSESPQPTPIVSYWNHATNVKRKATKETPLKGYDKTTIVNNMINWRRWTKLHSPINIKLTSNKTYLDHLNNWTMAIIGPFSFWHENFEIIFRKHLRRQNWILRKPGE